MEKNGNFDVDLNLEIKITVGKIQNSSNNYRIV